MKIRACRIIACILALLLVSGVSFAGSDEKAARLSVPEPDFTAMEKRLPKSIFSAVTKVPDKPHFLQGFEREKDEWKQAKEVARFFRTDYLMGSGSEKTAIDKSKAGYARPSGETSLGDTLVIDGKTTALLYADYHFAPDGMYTFWSRAVGEKNLAEFSPLYRKFEVQWGVGHISDDMWRDVKRLLGWAEFQAVHSFVKAMIAEGLEKNVRDYGAMQLTSRVIANRAVWLDDPNYGKRLDTPVPGTKNLTNRDFLPVPCVLPRCFLPDVVIISAVGGEVGGFTNAWKADESEVIVGLMMQGLALQYLSEWPLVAHEFVHANPYLQGLPFAFYFDVEMWAALTTDLQAGMLEFFYHGYLSVVRDSVKTVFGYDAEEAGKRIFPESLGVRDIREEEFRAHVKEVARIRNELVDFISNPDDGLMVSFYSDPYFWQAVSTQYCDTAAPWRILLSLRYEPAGIYNPKNIDDKGTPVPPHIQTKQWLSKEIESGRIKRLAEKAMSKVGSPSKFAKEFEKEGKASDSTGLSKCPVDSRFFYGDEKETNALKAHIRATVARARAGDAFARSELLRLFSGNGALRALSVK